MGVSERMKRMPHCVGIVIDEAKKSFSGRIYHCYSDRPQMFNDITELFYLVENVMDAVNFPALKTKNRTFKKTESFYETEVIDVENKVLSVEELIPEDEPSGYVLMITSRDNSTWQGLLYDKASDVESGFNSEVELIRLLK